jgi:DNA-binding SARP family transcriptional activator
VAIETDLIVKTAADLDDQGRRATTLLPTSVDGSTTNLSSRVLSTAPLPTSKRRLKICLLDGFAIECDAKRIEIPLSAQRLLAFLAFQERPVLRPYVAGSLWLDKPEERANANLRASLWRLRQAGLEVVEAVGNHVSLAHSVTVDARDSFVLANQLVKGQSTSLDDAALDTLILSGEILPDWYEDWVVIERERLRQLRLHALEALCEHLMAAGHVARAIDVGLTAIAAEPLRESAHRALISAFLAEGNQAEALRQHEKYCSLLWQELGLAPSRQMLALVESLGCEAG